MNNKNAFTGIALALLFPISLASAGPESKPDSAKQTIGHMTCEDGDILKFDQLESEWACAIDDTGSGAGTTHVVKDSTSTIIGQAGIENLPNEVRTIANIQGFNVPLVVTKTTISARLTTESYFDTIDCSGQIWVNSAIISSSFTGFNMVVGEATDGSYTQFRLLQITSDITVPGQDIQSVNYGGTCYPSGGGLPLVLPAQEIITNLSTLYSPPYTVEIQ